MNEKYQKIIRWFGETYFYVNDNQIEKENAEFWLQDWKKNLLFKLKRDTYSAKLIDEQYIHRPSSMLNCLSDQYDCLGLKICVEIEFVNEIKF